MVVTIAGSTGFLLGKISPADFESSGTLAKIASFFADGNAPICAPGAKYLEMGIEIEFPLASLMSWPLESTRFLPTKPWTNTFAEATFAASALPSKRIRVGN